MRVLVAKVGLDGHDRGAKVVTQMLREAGMEVTYLGIHQTCEAIVEAAIQEDVDVLGLSSLGGGHLVYTRTIIELLREKGAGDTPVVVGGTLPVEDIPALEAMGVRAVFPAGSLMTDIVREIRRLAPGPADPA
ncbi:MAG: cobalamin B12-binding domain-containing protein [Candidatus Rokubacteria bacterium]|nr:cobalamin B12-binding domain-containing protein [Candidatus Rokubacteria bacterium]